MNKTCVRSKDNLNSVGYMPMLATTQTIMFLVKKILNIVNPKPSFFAFSRVVRKVVVPFFSSMSGEQHAVRYLRLLFSPTLNDAATCALLCDKSGQIANPRYIKLPKLSYIGCVFLACTSCPGGHDAKHEIRQLYIAS